MPSRQNIQSRPAPTTQRTRNPHTRRGISGRKTVLALLIAIAVGSAAMYWFVYHARKTHDWIGRQLIAITNTYLVPQLSFKTLTYTAPGTVKLGTAKLTAPDGTDVIDVAQLTLTLAQTPRSGRPLQIEIIEIVGGKLHLIRDQSPQTSTPTESTPRPGESTQTDDEPELRNLADYGELRFALRGLSPFLKSQLDAANAQAAQQQALPANESSVYTPQTKLSDVFVLRRVTLTDCAIEYDPSDGTPSTIIDGITAEIIIRPETDGNDQHANEQGWYAVNIVTSRPPVSTITIDAEINIDTLDFRLHTLDIAITLDAYSTRSLPGTLQRLVTQHGVRANANLRVAGHGNLEDPASIHADAVITLDECSAILGEYRVPIERLVATTQLRGLNAETAIDAVIAAGTLRANFSLVTPTEGEPSLAFDWDVSDINLEQFFASMQPSDAPTADTANPATAQPQPIPPDSPEALGLVRRVDPDAPNNQQTTAQQTENTDEPAPPDTQPSSTPPTQPPSRLVGLASSTGQLSTSPQDPVANVQGTGEMTLRNSQLVSVPVVSQLASAMQLVLRTSNTHSLEATFDITPQGLQITRSLLRTEVLAARGTGLVGFDGTLDLRVNGGPLERVQSLLGGIGDVFGAVTDNIMNYRVRGTFAEPTVTVHPLGFGAAPRQSPREHAHATELSRRAEQQQQPN